jgi:phosphate acetyltransferase
MNLADSYIARARHKQFKIVLPEGGNARILAAARHLRDENIALPVLLGSPAEIATAAREAGVALDGIEIVDPRNDPRMLDYGAACAANRKTLSHSAGLRLMAKPLYFAGMMVRQGHAHAMVAGASNPTRRVIEAGLLTIGLAAGIAVPSSFFLVVPSPASGQGGKPLIFADCAVNACPTDEELADIALASLRSSEALLEDPIRIAMLSFSTKGSAQHPSIDKVKCALEMVRARAPDAMIDGELQVDAALNPAIAKRKLADPGNVAGQANVLIFPDLNAGNIGYKLLQSLSGAKFYGPILQGFSQPISDLSRGATVDEIVMTCAILLALAQK